MQPGFLLKLMEYVMMMQSIQRVLLRLYRREKIDEPTEKRYRMNIGMDHIGLSHWGTRWDGDGG